MPWSTTSARLSRRRKLTGVDLSIPNLEHYDIYLAPRCGERFELVAVNAGAAQFAGDWLYYLHDQAVWRVDLATRGVPEEIVRPAAAFVVSGDALMWAEDFRGSRPAVEILSRG